MYEMALPTHYSKATAFAGMRGALDNKQFAPKWRCARCCVLMSNFVRPV